MLLIPHTLEVTTWNAVQAGDSLNIEIDMMARYAARLADWRGRDSSVGNLSPVSNVTP